MTLTERPVIRPELLAILACPTCGDGRLQLSSPGSGKIETNTVAYISSASPYPTS